MNTLQDKCNFAHIELEWRKLEQNRMIYEQIIKNQTRTERYVDRTARDKFSITLMLGQERKNCSTDQKFTSFASVNSATY